MLCTLPRSPSLPGAEAGTHSQVCLTQKSVLITGTTPSHCPFEVTGTALDQIEVRRLGHSISSITHILCGIEPLFPVSEPQFPHL